MDPGRPLTGTTIAAVAAGIRAASPRLAAALGDDAELVHMDDLYAGWTLTGAVARLEAGVLRPLGEGAPGAYHRFDWHADRFDPDPVPVRAVPVLVVEGCGSAPRRLDAWTTLRVWVEAPPPMRMERGLARDGAAMTAHWQRWAVTEAAEFAREDTRRRADLRIDGTRGGDAGVVLLP